MGLPCSQRQKRSSTYWLGAGEVWVDKKYGWASAVLAEIRRLGSYCRSFCGGRRMREIGPGCGVARVGRGIPSQVPAGRPQASKQLPSNPELHEATTSLCKSQFWTLPESGDKGSVLVQPCQVLPALPWSPFGH